MLGCALRPAALRGQNQRGSLGKATTLTRSSVATVTMLQPAGNCTLEKHSRSRKVEGVFPQLYQFYLDEAEVKVKRGAPQRTVRSWKKEGGNF